jgi:tetratricopeptide (TPR) repeat protein
MQRTRSAAALAVVLLLFAGTSPASPQEAMEATKGGVKADVPAALRDLCTRVEADAPQAIASFDLDALAPADAHAHMVGLGSEALEADLPECAHALFLEAERRLPGDVDLAVRLAWLERYLRLEESAAARVVYIAGKDLAQLDGEDVWVQQLIFALPKGSTARVGLLQALFDAHWDPLPPAASENWFDLAEARLADDDIDGTRAAIARVTSPSVIARLRIDRRFDALVDRTAERFDLRHAAEAELAAMRARSARTPRVLEVHVAIISALLELGRADEALAEADAMEAAVAAAPENKPAFDDADQLVWLRNFRTMALRRLGRIDEAVAALETASRMTEDGRVNVSQVLNLADFLNRLGRADAAHAALARVGTSLSGYGRMVQMQEEMYAALLDGDRAGAGVALAYLLEHADDAPGIVRGALLDMDRTDEAAAHFIAELAAPATRADALLDVQDFQSVEPLPGDVERIARWRRLLDRADVRAVIDQVGRREHYDVHRWGEMD